MKRQLFLLAIVGGCAVHNDARYCDPSLPCADPAFPFCDPVAHECEATGPELPDLLVELDLSVPMPDGADLSVLPDLTVIALPDLTPLPDLTALPDLTPLPDLMPLPDLTPQCVTSSTCLDPDKPICDPVMQICRACTGSGDDTACLLHAVALHCKLSGKNAGRCEPCNTNNDCLAATPFCTSDGTCRKCAAHSECFSNVCDLRPGGTNGQCVDSSNIIYADSLATCAGADGTALKPYCQITTAVTNIGSKVFISVKPRATHYNGIDFTANTIAYFAGGPSGSQFTSGALPIIDANATNSHSIGANQNGTDNVTLDLTFDGFQFNGVTGSSNLYCDAGNKSSTLVIKNSVMTGGDRAVNAFKCVITVSESLLTGGAIEGIAFANMSNWDMHNCMVTASAGVGVHVISTNGSFHFNTVSGNGTGLTAGGVACPGGGGFALDSSIISGNTHAGASAPGTQFAGTCNLTNVMTGAAGSDSANGGLTGTPSFVSSSNLHLKVDTGPDVTTNRACCIDKAPVNGNTIDIDVETRPKAGNANADVGADEAL